MGIVKGKSAGLRFLDQERKWMIICRNWKRDKNLYGREKKDYITIYLIKIGDQVIGALNTKNT